MEPRFDHDEINKESVLDASATEKCFLEEKLRVPRRVWSIPDLRSDVRRQKELVQRVKCVSTPWPLYLTLFLCQHIKNEVSV